jgi:hypothetical protein
LVGESLQAVVRRAEHVADRSDVPGKFDSQSPIFRRDVRDVAPEHADWQQDTGVPMRSRVIALIVTSVIALTACGSATLEQGSIALVRASVEKTSDAGTAAFTMDISTTGTVSGEAFPAVEVQAQGVASFRTTDVEMTVRTVVPGSPLGSIDMQVKSVDGVFYMQFPAQLTSQMGLPPGVEWLSMDFGRLTGLSAQEMQALGGRQFQTPSQMLDFLTSIGADVDEVGTEQVAGVRTTRYAVSTTFGAMIEDQAEIVDQLLGSQGLPTEFISSLEDVVIPMDLYIDSDGLARRLTISMDMSEAAGILGAEQARAIEAFTVTTDLTFTEFDVPVDVQPPPPNATVDARELLGRGF